MELLVRYECFAIPSPDDHTLESSGAAGVPKAALLHTNTSLRRLIPAQTLMTVNVAQPHLNLDTVMRILPLTTSLEPGESLLQRIECHWELEFGFDSGIRPNAIVGVVSGLLRKRSSDVRSHVHRICTDTSLGAPLARGGPGGGRR